MAEKPRRASAREKEREGGEETESEQPDCVPCGRSNSGCVIGEREQLLLERFPSPSNSIRRPPPFPLATDRRILLFFCTSLLFVLMLTRDFFLFFNCSALKGLALSS